MWAFFGQPRHAEDARAVPSSSPLGELRFENMPWVDRYVVARDLMNTRRCGARGGEEGGDGVGGGGGDGGGGGGGSDGGGCGGGGGGKRGVWRSLLDLRGLAEEASDAMSTMSASSASSAVGADRVAGSVERGEEESSFVEVEGDVVCMGKDPRQFGDVGGDGGGGGGGGGGERSGAGGAGGAGGERQALLRRYAMVWDPARFERRFKAHRFASRSVAQRVWNQAQLVRV